MDPKEAQAARSKKYNIAIKDGGHVTKPGEWSSVSDDDFLDPVNYRYPCPNADQTRAAASYWGNPDNQSQYSSEEKAIINRRLAEMEKKFKIGDQVQAAMSFSETRRAICQALTSRFPNMHGDIEEVYNDHCIVSDGENNLYEVPYGIDANGTITFGEWMKVRRQTDYVRVSSASRLKGADGDPKSKDYGYKWQVQIIEAGTDLQNGAIYPYEVLKAAIPLYEGAKVFALSQGQHAHPDNPYGKSVRDLVGWISEVRANDKGLEGTLNILKNASWLRDMLVDAFGQGKKDLIGLSHDILARTEPGSAPAIVREIVKVDSVDIVYDPIAGGKFLRMAAAARAAGQKEATMLKAILAALKSKRPDLKTQIEALEAKGDAVTEDEVTALVAAAAVKQEDDPKGEKIKEEITKLVASLTDITGKQAKETLDKAMKLFEDTVKLNACANLLVEEINGSELPDLLKKRIRKQFEGKIFEEADLKAAIKEEKEIADKLSGSGAVIGVGGLAHGSGPWRAREAPGSL